MAVIYDFYQSPNPNSEEQEATYHPRVVPQGETVTTQELAREIQRTCSLTESDAIAALSAFSQLVASNLMQSRRVHLEGIGYFQMVLNAPATNNPRGYNAQNIHFKTVRIRADKQLEERFRGANLTFQRAEQKAHSAKRTPEEIDLLLAEYFTTHAYITTREFAALMQFTYSTANKYIARLRNEGKLINNGTRLHPIYHPAPNHYATD